MSVGIGQSSGITRIYVLFYTCKWFLEKLKIEDCDKEHRPLRKSFNVPLSMHDSKQRKPSPVERTRFLIVSLWNNGEGLLAEKSKDVSMFAGISHFEAKVVVIQR